MPSLEARFGEDRNRGAHGQVPHWWMGDFDRSVIEAAVREREVELTTQGRRTGKAHRTTLWISSDGRLLFVRSGGGLGRDWPRNLLARGRGVLKVGSIEVPVVARHLTDPAQARSVSELVSRKYGINRPADGGPPTPAEQATFELLPED
jgi:deazaflavin-dependent oxidoreductase (nitroreductase family)